MADLLGLDLLLDPDEVKIYEETESLPMSSSIYPIVICFCFVGFLYILGPFLQYYFEIEDPSPRTVTRIAFGYECFTYANFVLAATMTAVMCKLKYSFWCQPVNPKEEICAHLMWWFYALKILESLEVVIWLFSNELRIRDTEFLVYHHITSILMSWLAIKIVPGGTALVLASINTWAHFLMFLYFSLRWKGYEMRPYRMPVMLILFLHFIISAVICVAALQINCGFPKSVAIGLIYYMVSLIVGYIMSYGRRLLPCT